MSQADFVTAILARETGLGFVVALGVNDALDFEEGVTGVASGTVAAATYKTPALLAAAVQAAINAAATDNTYTATYDPATQKITIARATGTATISLLWDSGANKATSVAGTIGFSDAADDSGATTYAADNAIDPSDPAQEVDIVNLTADYAGAVAARLVEVDPESPAGKRLLALQIRLQSMTNEVSDSGAGLEVR